MARPAISADVDIDAVQRRTVRTMTLAQVFSALGNGSTLALGSILAVDLSGREGFAGATTTAMTLAPALLAIPLSTLAVRREIGRASCREGGEAAGGGGGGDTTARGW